VTHSDVKPGYLETRRPRYVLTTRTVIEAPIEEVFDFFSRPENLGVITPPKMGFRITEHPGRMADGALISYRVRVGTVPIRWRTRIEAWRQGDGFVDSQLRGPYHCWWHIHRFVADGPRRTVMEDRVLYTPPLGIVGRLANFFFIRGQLRAIFAHRAGAIALRFGRRASTAPRREAALT
jgi:ligand-binding SRPBCC domain-containing protein